MPKDPTRASTARSPKLQNTVRLSADGVAKVLGDLEARVMHTVWAFGEPVPARTVHEQIAEEHDVSPLTVITVLNRLVAKRLLRRRKRDGLLHFEACLTEEEFLVRASRHVVEGVLDLSAEAVTASFVDVCAERDPERLVELGRLIQRRLKQDRGTKDR